MDKKVGCAILTGIALVGIPIRGWALSVLWGWFVTPLGLPAIGIAHAYGLALLIGRFSAFERVSTKGKELEDTIAESAASAIVAPLLFVLIGWIISGWM